jgi:hypothetical protein
LLQLFILIRCAALAAVLLLGACASRGGVEQGVVPATDTVATIAAQAEYRVGPSDLLSVTVFRSRTSIAKCAWTTPAAYRCR